MQARTVGRNIIIYAIGIVALRATSFLLIPLYTHFLSMKEFAILSTILITIQLMIYVMPVGTWDSVCKFFGKYKTENMISSLFGTSLILSLFGGILTSILALTLFLPLLNRFIQSKETGKYVFLACLISLGQSLCQLMMAYYRAQNKAVSYLLIGMISSALLLVLTPIFIIMLNLGILGALYAQVIAYLAVFFVVYLKLNREFKFTFSLNSFKSLISFGIPLVISSLSMFVIQSSCIYFLGYYGTLEDIAIFSLGNKFSAILAMLIMSPFQLAFAPYFYSHSHTSEMKSFLPRIFIIMNFVSLILAYIILFLIKLVFPMIAPSSYFASYTVCIFLIPGIILFSIKVIGETILYNFNETARAGLIAFIFALGNLLINYLLIPHFKIYGAVASSSLTMALLSITILKLGADRYPFNTNLKKLVMINAMLILVLVNFFLIRNFALPIFIVISLLLFAIILVFFFSNVFLELSDRAAIKKMLFQLIPIQRNL